MSTVAIVQARMGSTRFPGKVLKRIGDKPMIQLLLERLARAEQVDQVVVATSRQPEDDVLANFALNCGVPVFRGNEDDVLGRYHEAALLYGADVIVRITGDCPLVDPILVDAVVSSFTQEEVDYMSNVSPPTFPDGLDIEVMSMQVLHRAATEANDRSDREHVTSYIRDSGLFNIGKFLNDNNLSDLRWTVDEPEDLVVVSRVFDHFSPQTDFGWSDVLQLVRSDPVYFGGNRHFSRNEGANVGTGQKLWKRAKRIIPGGNMLLSKRAEMFLPEQWPAYFSKAKGCKVWDLDGNEYTDMSIMGIGTNILGYGHPDVDESVIRTVRSGNMSTLNCPEEVYLAERLVDIHPWADMARFARTGGEANAVAIRIGRAASGRDKVAVCGYHGWHDWYLSANLGDDENLDGHLLPGLEPKGVPRNLKDTVFPFTYNRFDELQSLVDTHDIGVIKMEVARNMGPQEDFLGKVRKLATDNGIVLIFDECTSGFRETFGGLHMKYGVDPDMAMFGKALGNGYSITAAVGRREIMEAAQSTFISSTFWTERTGPSAALKTLEVMEETRSWDIITNTGRSVRKRWQELADRYDVKISHFGLPALAGFTVDSPNALAYKTLITQEMLASGYLAGTSLYACTEHTSEIVDKYFEALDPLFGLIGECEAGRDVGALLKGPECHSGFKRLN